MEEVNGTIFQIYPNKDIWVEEVAAFIYCQAQLNVFEKSKFILCLAGGSTPQKVYERLAKPPYKRAFPWSKTLLFWGDERAVLPNHPDSNYRMVKQAMLDHVNIPPEQVFALTGAVNPETAAAKYAQLLQDYIFDLVLLGLGTDGHTASLFPDTTILTSKKRAEAVYVPRLDSMRISLSSAMINSSRKVAFLVSGEGKATILKKILQSSDEDPSYPAQLIKPLSGSNHWLLDSAAAKYLFA